MKDGRFEVGDRIKGTPESDKHYGITNTNMLEGLVAKAKTHVMIVYVMNHKDRREVGESYKVANSTKHFELIEEKEKEKEKEEEDFWENLEVL